MSRVYVRGVSRVSCICSREIVEPRTCDSIIVQHSQASRPDIESTRASVGFGLLKTIEKSCRHASAQPD